MDYLAAGFDSFLSRSIDNTQQSSLNSLGNDSTAIRYDSSQLSGVLGDTARLGLVQIQGREGVIAIYDTSGRTAISIGNPDDPGQLLVNKGAIYVYDRAQNPTIINGRLVGSKTLGKVKLTTAFTVPQNIVQLVKIVSSTLTFTIPDGVTTIKLTLNTGGGLTAGSNTYIFEKELTGTYFTDVANAKFIGYGSNNVTGMYFWFVDVTPGQTLSYYIAIPGSDAFDVTLNVTNQQPAIFMAEIA